MIHPRNNDTNRFYLFEKLLPEFKDKKILDFGGSSGNLLYFSGNKILEQNYTCVDVDHEAIQVGTEEFINSNFIHYNKYNQMYNTGGDVNQSFPNLNEIDYVWSYSVFSHTVINDILDTLKWMKSLNPKKIVVSYLNNDGDEQSAWTLNHFYEKRVATYGTCVDFRKNTEDYFYLSDNKYGENSCNQFIAVYNTSWLTYVLGQNGISARKISLPTSVTPIPFLEIS